MVRIFWIVRKGRGGGIKRGPRPISTRTRTYIMGNISTASMDERTCRKNQEKQIRMNTHQYVRIRPSGLRVLCQFRKFRISMITFIGRVSNIRSDSC